MEIKGWKFQVSSSGFISIKDDKGQGYTSVVMSGNKKILIQKNGTTRLLRFPKFVTDFVLEETRKATGNEDLVLVNKSK